MLTTAKRSRPVGRPRKGSLRLKLHQRRTSTVQARSYWPQRCRSRSLTFVLAPRDSDTIVCQSPGLEGLALANTTLLCLSALHLCFLFRRRFSLTAVLVTRSMHSLSESSIQSPSFVLACMQLSSVDFTILYLQYVYMNDTEKCACVHMATIYHLLM